MDPSTFEIDNPQPMSEDNSAFNFIPVFARGNKLAKAALTVGSMLAVSMAYIGNQNPTSIIPTNNLQSDNDILQNLEMKDGKGLRNLMAVQQDSPIINLSDSKTLSNSEVATGDLVSLK